jgi:hypothetical protein
MRASEVCHLAAELITGSRAEQHGEAKETHSNIAALWSAYLNRPITARDVALMMVLLKIARTKTNACNIDNFVDAAGYAGIAAELAAYDAP